MSSSHDDSDEENPDAYPWNSDVMSDVYETFAKVVARCNGNPVHPNHPGRIQVKEVLLGDPLQALTKGASGKWHTIKKNVPVLCVGPEDDLPYMGLVQKMWMESDAKPNEHDLYETGSFWLEMYWLYRLKEVNNFVPLEPQFSKDRLAGASFDSSKEEGSERQIMFSCHSSFGDVEDDAVCMDSCLHPVEVHWLLPREPVPLVYFEDSKGQLKSRRAPGFYIRYFFRWRGQEALSTVHPIDGKWDHADTTLLARKMREQYVERAKIRTAKNAELLRKHGVSTQQQRRSSEDGGAHKQLQKLKRLQQTGRQ